MNIVRPGPSARPMLPGTRIAVVGEDGIEERGLFVRNNRHNNGFLFWPEGQHPIEYDHCPQWRYCPVIQPALSRGRRQASAR
jgi:hypothetical protein